MQPFLNPSFQQPFAPGLAGGGAGPSRDLSHMDLSRDLGAVTSKGGLNIQFFWIRVMTRSKNAHTNGKYETRLCIAKQPKGDRLTIAHRLITDAEAQREFPAEFAYFKQYQDVPTAGTQLYEIPGLSQSQIALLVLNGIRSVEDLTGIPEDMISQAGFEAVTARKVALAWLSRRDKNAAVIDSAQIEARYETERRAMQDRLASLEASNKALMARLEAMTLSGGAAAQGGAASQGGVIEVSAPDSPGIDLPEIEVSEQEFVNGSSDIMPNPLSDED